MKMYKSFPPQQGQVLLIVILVLVVSLTVGLSVITRTITNIRTSEEEARSQQAFSAAEAGIEKLLNTNTPTTTGQLSNEASFQASSTVVQGNTFLVNNGNPTLKNDGVDIWLSTYPGYSDPRFSGTLTIYWGSSTDVCDPSPTLNTRAALELVLISGTSSTPVTTHYAVDPCSSRASTNNFSTSIQSGGTLNGREFAHRYSFAITNGLVVRIVPLYANTVLGVSGNGTALPSQGEVIESTGTSGQAQRKITVYKGYPKIPVEFFPFVLFSP